MAGTGGRGLLAMATGALVYLALETAFFHGIAYLNVRDDELWLRRTLAGRSYYLTESAVLLIGALTAAVWEAGAWFLVLLQALTAADRALMTAKLSGRNRVSSHELDADVPDLEPARNG
jgi:hypothetical protein